MGSRWYPGRIYAVNDGLTSVDVTFDDNDFRPNMPLDRVKLESGGHLLSDVCRPRFPSCWHWLSTMTLRAKWRGTTLRKERYAWSRRPARHCLLVLIQSGCHEVLQSGPLRVSSHRPLQRSVQGCPHLGRDAAISCEPFLGEEPFCHGHVSRRSAHISRRWNNVCLGNLFPSRSKVFQPRGAECDTCSMDP